MKKLLLFIVIIIFYNCSSNDSEVNPNLSFNIENGNRFASSEINATNTSTYYNGNYIWEVISNSGTETFSTKDLSFSADRVGDYTIKLKETSVDLEITQSISISPPRILEVRNVRLKQIPKDYGTLYFKIKKSNEGGILTFYTSDKKYEISSLNASIINWELTSENMIDLNYVYDFYRYFYYTIEFFDENDNLVTELNSFENSYDPDYHVFISGDKVLTTSSNGCNNCDYFEVLVDFGFKN